MKVHSLTHVSNKYSFVEPLPHAKSYVTITSPQMVDGEILNFTEVKSLESIDQRQSFTSNDFNLQRLVLSGVFDSLKEVSPSQPSILEESDTIESNFEKLSNVTNK